MVETKFPDWYEQNKKRFFKKINEKNWKDWNWQLSNRITTSIELKKFFYFIDEKEIESVIKKFPFAITPYLLSIINIDDPDNPILRQVLPSRLELDKSKDLSLDPFDEKNNSPVKNVIKRYPDRVVITVTNKCPAYCRYCTRKWMWGEVTLITKDLLNQIVGYLKSSKEIREVIISGGEPFMISPKMLEYIIKSILNIPHIEAIRIGTRILSFLPMRITKQLTSTLSKYKPVWIVTHFNHPTEITPYTEEAVNRLITSGVAICNQTVLLKGVNDDIEIMKSLVNSLQRLRVKPYYIFQCDLVEGTNHFRTPLRTGIEIMKKLRENTGGLCIPTYVIDHPKRGKIPILL